MTDAMTPLEVAELLHNAPSCADAIHVLIDGERADQAHDTILAIIAENEAQAAEIERLREVLYMVANDVTPIKDDPSYTISEGVVFAARQSLAGKETK